MKQSNRLNDFLISKQQIFIQSNMQLKRNTKEDIKQSKMPKISKKQNLSPPQKKSIPSFSISQRRNTYDALCDEHASGYFTNNSVQKHLKKLIKVSLSQNSYQVFRQLPKTNRNDKIVRSISQRLQVDYSGIKSKRNSQNNSENLLKIQNQGNQFINIHPAIKNNQQSPRPKQSPYKIQARPLSINKPIAGFQNQLAKLRSQSTMNLPKIIKNQYQTEKEEEILLNQKHKLNIPKLKQSKRAEKLNKLKHNQFLNFINRKRSQIINSDNAITKLSTNKQ